ncbi:PREDICTED: kinesin-like protein KIF21A [Priapulus caudatus]|uniref:Kinesin-like protein KIF21A n=1 Tax=Priapulus caudatus TaxID=37621 RepID=A0ABM1E058_PRICU|nr:PREDICTED: kinesin-like protein KIF21A [Priapulus caudatus]
MSIGKLSGGHQAAVMVMAMSTNDENGNVLVTGSKDHYIKVFGVPEYAAGVHTPKFSLDPPHYDGIQSLAIHGNSLFSGSRDTCIKKWDLAEKKLKFSMNQAHKDWVEALQLLPEQNCLLSGGRDGYLKVWNCDNCALVGEIRAHSSPINAIATNSSAIFTASNDQTIGVWKPRNNLSALVMDAGEDERIA